MAAAFTTTRAPFHFTGHHFTGHHFTLGHFTGSTKNPNYHGNELYKLVQHEVYTLLHLHPDLNKDTCHTKCDAVFDLVAHQDEQTTDQMCMDACNQVLYYIHHGTATMKHHHPTTARPP